MNRLFDLFCVILLLFLIIPLIFFGAILIALFDGFPIFFQQRRVGLAGKDFKLLKFRTMSVQLGSEEGSFNIGETSRVTFIGKFFRRIKLDEIPQIWNVLCGDMSLVGPRPEVRKWVDEFPSQWMKIHQIRPGITDPASIIYRNEEKLLSQSKYPEKLYREEILPEKLVLYEKYLNERTILIDIHIIFRTIVALFR
jgi:lipopolysaccharide/colanic/teichoic acid biosynthesis glycosyltransferase